MSTRGRYLVIVAVCVVVSVAGIVLAAFLDRTADGGRGGALAVMISFGALFLGRNYGALPISVLASRQSIHKLRQRGASAVAETPEDTLRRLDEQVEEIISALKAGQVHTEGNTRQQNVYLAIASVVGTLAWGFGDWAAILLCGGKI